MKRCSTEIFVSRKIKGIKENLGHEKCEAWVYAKIGKLNREVEKYK